MRIAFGALAALGLCGLAQAQVKEDTGGHAGHVHTPETPGPKSVPAPMEHRHTTESTPAPMEQAMEGMYGPYPMAREASGTAWQPDSTPHGGLMFMTGDWHVMIHGFANAVYDHQGGPRGDTKSFSESMLMHMAQRPFAGGTLGTRVMLSLDPLMGKAGYPLLFQTGETADGVTHLVDRQHPHNLFMELAASYSHRIGERGSAFIYAGLPGEPALGPAAFMHRFSGVDSPEAPLTHHWLDSTHITSGVVTLGYVRDRLKVEASAFRGREPDQFRYRIEPGKLDSASVRISLNPTDNWSLQVSHGFIKGAETLAPEVNTRRTTASVVHNAPLGHGNWQTTFAWGRNANDPGRRLQGYLLESALALHDSHTFFGRIERVEKDELFEESAPQHGQVFTVNKLSIGYIRDWKLGEHTRLGIGGLASAFSIPKSLGPVYGAHPTSYMVFVRARLD
jgi:hypothetical protein